MKVMKFGGSSLATAKHFVEVVQLVEQNNEATAVVCSAPMGITNALVELVTLLNQQNSWESLLDRISEQLLTLVVECGELRAGFDVTLSQQQTTELLEQLRRWANGCQLLGHCPRSTAAQIMATGEKFSALLLAGLLRSQHEVEVLNPATFILVDGDSDDPVVNLTRCQETFKTAHQKPAKLHRFY